MIARRRAWIVWSVPVAHGDAAVRTRPSEPCGEAAALKQAAFDPAAIVAGERSEFSIAPELTELPGKVFHVVSFSTVHE